VTGPTTSRGSTGLAIGIAAAVAIAGGILLRAWLLPARGYFDDLNQFAEWVHHIAVNGLWNAYDEQLSFGPVMAFVWWALGAIEPAFQTVSVTSDVGIRVLMKLPATIADFALAGTLWYALRARPWVAVAGAGVILAHPVIWFLSAWWGQYESIFALLVVAAVLLALRDREWLAVAALTAALMTKPQVAPLLVPFAAWFLARIGWRSRGALAELMRLALIGVITAIVLWLPFVAEYGPLNYIRGLGNYQDARYAVLSLNAWNLWWLVQELFAGGKLVPDSLSLAGPITFRLAGYGLAAVMLALVGLAVYRRPTPRQLVLGLAAAALVAFTFLTTMHERYGYAAVVFLALLLDDRRSRWLALAFGVVYTINLVAAASHRYLGGFIDVVGPNGIAGSLVTVAITLALVFEVARSAGRRAAPAAGEVEDGLAISSFAASESERTRPDTSAGSAGATSAA
jgi:dolichyl-phosphate-mannose-protein mannosyltransferase